MRNEKRILRNKAIYKALIIIFTIGILAVGGFSINYYLSKLLKIEMN